MPESGPVSWTAGARRWAQSAALVGALVAVGTSGCSQLPFGASAST